MHSALHSLAQSPQEVHAFSSILILKMEKREKIPSKVPTGHSVLQYHLPL
jgi:hypothetical protein